jgi:FAD/FMN-containing dehydrogenase
VCWCNPAAAHLRRVAVRGGIRSDVRKSSPLGRQSNRLAFVAAERRRPVSDHQVVAESGSAASAASPGGSLLAPAIDALRSRIRGALITPADDMYDSARHVWNGMVERRPGAIVRCSGNADVITAVNFAREQGVPLAVRGGGHNVAGAAVCDGGLVIDLSAMKSVRVDPERRTARVGGGATLGDVDHETQAFGLAVPIGAVSATGIGGLTLHGGMGFLLRKLGLTVDNLIGADVVTADGRLRTVDETHDADLLWALKGGGGNFGVVTSLDFRLHPIGPEVWIGMVLYPADRTERILRALRDLASTAPDELMVLGVLWNAPHDESIAAQYRGQPVCIVFACYCGPVEQGERVIQPLRELDTPAADFSGRMPFVAAQRLFDPEYPNGRRYYWKSTFLSGLGDDVIEALAGHAARRPSPLSSLDIWMLGGAFGRVPPAATAFALRRAPFLLGIESNWIDREQDEANVSWARGVHRDMQRFTSGGTYLNFPGFAEEGESLVKESYGENYARLQSLKRRYDPSNLFSQNLNITTG